MPDFRDGDRIVITQPVYTEPRSIAEALMGQHGTVRDPSLGDVTLRVEFDHAITGVPLHDCGGHTASYRGYYIPTKYARVERRTALCIADFLHALNQQEASSC